MASRIKRGIKRRETDPASNQFRKCSPLSGTHRFTELGREEKGEGGERGQSKGGESNQASNHTPK